MLVSIPENDLDAFAVRISHGASLVVPFLVLLLLFSTVLLSYRGDPQSVSKLPRF